MATGQKEYDQAICQGQQQYLPKRDLSVEPSTIALIGPKSTREEISKVYNDVYQLWRSPSKSPCDVEVEKRTHQDILDSIKEHLWHRWDHTQPEEGLRWSSGGASRPDQQAEFWDQMLTMYDHYKDLTEGSCKEALA